MRPERDTRGDGARAAELRRLNDPRPKPGWVCECGATEMRIDGKPHCGNCGAAVYHRGPWVATSVAEPKRRPADLDGPGD